MVTASAVRARTVSKCFGDVVALDGVDLDVPAGQLHGLVGPNGAGKTTLLGLLLGLAAPDGGSLEILGSRVGRTLDVPDGVAGFVDAPGLYPWMTARQNLAALAALRGAASLDPGEALEQVGLSDVADDRVRGFSLGMRQRLGLAAALLARPRLLVLDEPANGLDPAGRHHVHEVLDTLVADGVTVLLSSHDMDDVAALCDEVTILTTGRVVFSGPVGKLAAESADVAYRVRTSDPAVARAVASTTPGLRLPGPRSTGPRSTGPRSTGPRSTGPRSTGPRLPGVGAGRQQEPDVLLVRGPMPALEELVVRLVGAGVAVRELAPVVPPLEAAFLALTTPVVEQDDEQDVEQDGP